MQYVPHIISWNITRRCNLRCAHCYLDAGPATNNHDGDLPADECFRFIDQLAEVNAGAILIMTGGEPLLRPDIFRIGRYAADKGFTLVIGTNGILIDEEKAQRLVESGYTGVAISIDSIDADKHDRFRGSPHAWERSIAGARTVRKAGLDLLIQTSIFEWNRDELPQVAALAHALGATALNLYFLVCTGRGQGFTDIAPESHEETLRHVYRLQQEYDDRMLVNAKCAPSYSRIVHGEDPDSPYLRGFEGSGGCPAAWHYVRITPAGDVTPCPYLPISAGRLTEQSFAAIWNESQLFRQFRDRKLLSGRCGRCEFVRVCGGCRARAHADCGDYLAADPSCSYEPGQLDGETVRLPDEAVYAQETRFTMTWDTEAMARIERIPSFVRGLVATRIETLARKLGHTTVSIDVVQKARRSVGPGRSRMASFLRRRPQ